ncbi:MAG: hypothetical protein ACR2RF_10880 [Geminicoccaceae bacterium]
MPEPGMGANNDHGVSGSDRSTDRPDDNDRGGSREDKESFDRAMDNAERPDRASAETTAGRDDKNDTRATDNDDNQPERAAGPPGIGAPPSSSSPTDTTNETDELNLDGKTVVTVTSNPGDLAVQLGPHGTIPPDGAINYPPIGNPDAEDYNAHGDYFDPGILADIITGERLPISNEERR